MATVIKPKRSETALAVPTAGSLEVGELAHIGESVEEVAEVETDEERRQRLRNLNI